MSYGRGRDPHSFPCPSAWDMEVAAHTCNPEAQKAQASLNNTARPLSPQTTNRNQTKCWAAGRGWGPGYHSPGPRSRTQVHSPWHCTEDGILCPRRSTQAAGGFCPRGSPGTCVPHGFVFWSSNVEGRRAARQSPYRLRIRAIDLHLFPAQMIQAHHCQG